MDQLVKIDLVLFNAIKTNLLVSNEAACNLMLAVAMNNLASELREGMETYRRGLEALAAKASE